MTPSGSYWYFCVGGESVGSGGEVRQRVSPHQCGGRGVEGGGGQSINTFTCCKSIVLSLTCISHFGSVDFPAPSRTPAAALKIPGGARGKDIDTLEVGSGWTRA